MTGSPPAAADRAPYTGRFAPSPTGALHAGSLVAALASWLDARAHGGRWLLRLEDVDTPRCVPGAAPAIVQQLARCGLLPDEAPVHQSARGALYQQALDDLLARDLAYPCGCTRSDIERALAAAGRPHERHSEMVYPGTCRHGLAGRAARAWRFKNPIYEQKEPQARIPRAWAAIKNIANDQPGEHDGQVHWTDRRLGPQHQDVAREVGDFVLRRADGLWAYQLAVVVDDAAQGVTHVVRGEDLADNTARQIALQRALGVPTPAYLHTPLVRGADGDKLSKQNGAQPLDLREPLMALRQAAAMLELQLPDAPATLQDWLAQAVAAWRARWAQTG